MPADFLLILDISSSLRREKGGADGMTVIILFAVIAAIILLTAVWKIHPLPVLLAGAFVFGVSQKYGVTETIGLISGGFGNTVKSIGIVIITGTVIGVFMEKRGALTVIGRRIIAMTGKRRTPLAMSIIGFIVSICIFCDSAFIILVGVWRKMAAMTRLPPAVGVVALSMGLFASHCFIPPTPGPLAAISILQADFSLVLLFGSLAALAATAAGYFYGMAAGKKEVLHWEDAVTEVAEKEKFSVHWSMAFLPLLIPLILIGSASAVPFFGDHLPPAVVKTIVVAGSPVPALTIGAVIAVFFIGRCKLAELSADGLMGKAVFDSANILIITGAGGAFGAVLQKVDPHALLPGETGSPGVFAIFIPLFFAAVLKISQGSSTLAILTAAGITLPLLDVLGLNTPVMRALSCCAVCCGGMIVSHTNDSFFWVVTKFSGMSVRQGLKLQTVGSLVSGTAAGVTIFLLALLLHGR